MIDDLDNSALIYSEIRNSTIKDWITTCSSLNHLFYNPLSNKDKIIKQYKTIIDQIRVDNKNFDLESLYSFCSETLLYFELVNEWQYWFSLAKDIIDILESEQKFFLYYGFGRFFEETDQLSLSEEYHKQAITFFSDMKEKNDLSLALNYLGLGIVYSRLSNPKAYYYLNKSEKLFRKLGEYYYWACAVADIGGNYFRKGNLIKSTISYIKAIFIFYLFRFHEDLQRTLYSLSITLLKTQHLKILAYPVLIIANRYTNELKISRYPILLLYAMGRLFSELNQFKQADNFLDSALQNYRIYYDQFKIYPENLFNILYHLILVNIKAGNWDNAYKYIQYLETFTLANLLNTKRPGIDPATMDYYDSVISKIIENSMTKS